MKKLVITLLLASLSIFSFSQKMKPSLGFEGGMGGGGMQSLMKTENPFVVTNSELKKSWAYSYGPFLQLMSQKFGIEAKLNFNSFSAEAESFVTPEKLALSYVSIPIIMKFCISSKEGVTSSSWSDEKYTLIGNTLYHTPGEYSAGGNPFTANVFIYGGMQFDQLKKATHTYGTTNSTTESIISSMSASGTSYVAGLEMTMNMLSFDFSYQQSLETVIPGKAVKLSGFFVKIRLRII
jgi:hypothetical protein